MIWISIGLLVALDAKTVGFWALIFLVGGAVITTIIANVIARGRAVERT